VVNRERLNFIKTTPGNDREDAKCRHCFALLPLCVKIPATTPLIFFFRRELCTDEH
jgi:hypothetical protein